MWIATLSGHRTATRAAAALTAALVAGMFLGTAPAHAGDGQTVRFTGGATVLVCKSRPSADSLAVPVGTSVTFVNALGQDATLQVGGVARAVPANRAVTVDFTTGPRQLQVSMTYGCGIGVTDFDAMTVQVTQATTGGSSGTGSTGGGAGSAATAASGATPAGTGAAPGHGSTGRVPAQGRSASPAASAPVAALPTPVDTSSAGAPVGDAPTGAATDPTIAAGKGSDGYDVGDAVPASGAVHDRVSSMLALLALVFVLGLMVAAVRVVLAQRAMREQTV
jgi:hypothetical protein